MERSPPGQSGNAGQRDDRATPIHELHRLAGAQEGAADMDGQHPDEGTVVHERDLRALAGQHLVEAVARESIHAGVVDLDVELSVGTVDLRKDRAHRRLIGHVTGERPVAVTIQEVQGLVGSLPAEVLGGHRGPLFGEPDRHGPTQAGTGTGDAGDPSLEASRHGCSLLTRDGRRRPHRNRPSEQRNGPARSRPRRQTPRARDAHHRARPDRLPDPTTRPSDVAVRRPPRTHRIGSHRSAQRRV